MQINSETQKPNYYTVAGLQKLLGIGRNSAYKLIGTKDFPCITVGNKIIIPADRFDQWVSEQIACRGGVDNG